MTLVQSPITRFFSLITSQKRLRLYVWLSLATQILIVVTGGLVRLTGSGLGCPTWPKCTDDSIISTPEMGIHGLIEFGNRLLTFVLLIVALLTFITILRPHADRQTLTRVTLGFFAFVAIFIVGLVFAVRVIDFTAISLLAISTVGMLALALAFLLRVRRVEKKSLVGPAFGLGFGIILQAIVGGVTVLTQLNSWIVGLHFLISGVLISVASLLVFRALPKPIQEVNSRSQLLAIPVVLVSVVTIVIGVLVTGAGPHAGDASTPRNGLDLEIWQHYHSYPGYVMLGLILLQWLFQLSTSKSLWASLPTRVLGIFLSVTALQAIVGIIQSRLGVPELLVAVHMFGAAILCSLVTFQFLVLKSRT